MMSPIGMALVREHSGPYFAFKRIRFNPWHGIDPPQSTELEVAPDHLWMWSHKHKDKKKAQLWIFVMEKEQEIVCT